MILGEYAIFERLNSNLSILFHTDKEKDPWIFFKLIRATETLILQKFEIRKWGSIFLLKKKKKENEWWPNKGLKESYFYKVYYDIKVKISKVNEKLPYIREEYVGTKLVVILLLLFCTIWCFCISVYRMYIYIGTKSTDYWIDGSNCIEHVLNNL